MIYLSGVVRRELVAIRNVGFLLTPTIHHKQLLTPTVPWAADTGCFTQGERFSLPGYLAWLERLQPYRQTCAFATAPDIVGDWEATWRRSARVLPEIRRRGFPAALVGQDGLTRAAQLPWETFDALFIGGTTRFKLAESTYRLVAEATQRGKWTHMGRVNSGLRLRAAHAGGYDSVDGTRIRYQPSITVPDLARWMQSLEQHPLPLWEGAAMSRADENAVPECCSECGDGVSTEPTEYGNLCADCRERLAIPLLQDEH